jgi:erythromycin esterase-like protein
MAARGEFNVGQLVRERYENQVRLVGFTTYDGTVAAASRWDGPVQQKYVRPALRDSFEWLFHQLGFGAFYLDFARRNLREALTHARLERAIGVIYRPETERVSHYFDAQLPLQFNAVIHVDHTRAVEPLERMPDFSRPELPETFPAGL